MAAGFLTSTLSGAAAGAGLEIVFSRVLKLVVDLKKQISMFGLIMKNIEETLRFMEPKIKKMDVINRDLDRPEEMKELIELMERGEELIKKCLKIHKYNYIKIPQYARKLLKFDKSLKRYIKGHLLTHMAVGVDETRFEVAQISNQVRDISNQISRINMGPTNGWQTGMCTTNGGVFMGVSCSCPGLNNVDTVGLEIPLSDLKGKLLKEEMSLIVVSAPGGCGKTTLVKVLCQDSEVKDKYNGNIFFITVSKVPNLMVIIKRLFQHIRNSEPQLQCEEDAVSQLEFLFKQIGQYGPVLLVLDDIWSGSESLLEKLMFRIKDYKILVTSRFEFPRFGDSAMYKLQTLSDADAMTLFYQSAFLSYRDLYIQDQDLVNQIVRSCKGFPLAISVVGKSLCGKPAAEWRRTANLKASSILSNVELLDRLQSSVDALNDKPMVKESYMDLGSFPEDQEIPARALIDLFVELHKLDEDTAIANIHELSERNLVDLVFKRKDASEEDGYYGGLFVKQHDLLRELAIRQSNSGSIERRKRLFIEISGNKMPEWWVQQEQPPISAKLLSISTDEAFLTNWHNVQVPAVEALVLNLQTKNYTLPDFMERMDKLKVLLLTNNGFFPAEPNNFQLLGSLCNLKRIRLEKLLIPSSFLTCMRLMKLEKLSLVMCNVVEAFGNFAVPISDSFPNLVEMDIDYCNDLEELPAGFCDLILLKRLSITNCHKLYVLPEDFGNLVNLEVLRLSSCIELSELPGTIRNLQNLRVLDLSDCLSIRELREEIGELKNLRRLYMIDCSNCQLPPSVMDLSLLKEVIADEETANLWEHFKSFLPDLKIKVHKDINLNWLH